MNKIKINGIYKHFKGNYYLVEDIVIDSETNKEMILYKALYDECIRFVRPKENFLSKVDKEKYPNIKQIYRFELVNIKTVNKR